jgi:hypothetical protein
LLENETNNEVLLFDDAKAVVEKLANVARAECHDFAQEHTDIRVRFTFLCLKTFLCLDKRSKHLLCIRL